MNMRFALLLALAGLVLPACAATGDSPGYGGDDSGGVADFGREGTYFQAGWQESHVRKLRSMAPVDSGSSDKGYSARLGYRLEPDFAVEVESDRATGYGLNVGPARAKLDTLSIALQGKYFFCDRRAQPYALLGAGWTRAGGSAIEDQDAFFARGGVGMDYYLSETLALFAEGAYSVPTLDLHSIPHVDLQAGLIIRF